MGGTVTVDIARTFGALLIGGIIAATFSGVVTVQTFLYFKLYPDDKLGIKLLAFAVWLLDTSHTAFVSLTLWHLLITHFGNGPAIDHTPWSMAITIALTAILTFLVHCFFVYRIYKLSDGNCYIASFLGFLAFARLSFACLTTSYMIHLELLSEFVKRYTWAFTLGLALSSILDILITGFLCYLLKSKQKKHPSCMDRVLDSLMIYAFENGSLTCAATIVAMICWLIMPHNLIFMGLHFVISKFYANSLLATLNTRKKFYKNRLSAMQGTDLPQLGRTIRTLSDETACSTPTSKHFPDESPV
ncbi:hypothetical protein AMATHDRAFT_68959 [Amanita thiersii Skay4041]|uniref:DUF6534 domain-containing protein n=1 Tax=Amanita thiersii Skay4041 TaxID=703135 RepID=A0A2A9NF19_9AGAR|nr:hypothetical protein AMATHDRAFT_68959 [Amanita thiersii Skay4041]